MLKHSVINDIAMKSPLNGLDQMRPKKSWLKSSMHMVLSLTSLVDAFSILVIYLLVNTQSANEQLNIQRGLQLPVAANAKNLEKATVLKVVGNQYFVGEEPVPVNEIAYYLRAIENNKPESERKERPELIIQADKRINFDVLNPIITGASSVGFYKIKFAVISEESG